MTLRIGYYAYKDFQLSCPDCNWSGIGQEASQNHEGTVLDLECPSCFKMLAIIDFPTIGQTLYKGSEADRKALLRQINFQEKFKRMSLKSSDELPNLSGSGLSFTFRSTTIKGEDFNIIELDGKLVWQEPMVFEGYERFMEIGNIMKEKYGSRMVDLIPDETAELFLYGDKVRAPNIIADYRENLHEQVL